MAHAEGRLDRERIRAICFDVDGTLSDSDDRWTHRFEKMLQPVRGLMPGRDAHAAARWLVMSLETPGNLVYEALDRLHLDDEAGRLVSAMARLRRDRHDELLLVPGVDAMLAGLHGRYPLAVVSARGAHSTGDFLEQFGLRGYFQAVATALTCTYTKPFPDPIVWAAEQMGVAPGACLMVGDTTVDIRAGKAAGAQTVGVLCGFGREGELRRAGADLILQSTAELAGVLD